MTSLSSPVLREASWQLQISLAILLFACPWDIAKQTCRPALHSLGTYMMRHLFLKQLKPTRIKPFSIKNILRNFYNNNNEKYLLFRWHLFLFFCFCTTKTN